MGVVVKNVSFSISVSLTILKCVGLWPSECLTRFEMFVYYCYGFVCFMFVLGTYIIGQVVDLLQVWGDLPTMTSTAVLLFTNLAHFTKVVNLVARRSLIQTIINDAHEDLSSATSEEGKKIVNRCNFKMKMQQLLYYFITTVTITGWAASPEKGSLLIRTWYPFDATKSPAYDIAYVHQVFSVLVCGFLNVSKDTLVATLIAQCQCRLQLLGLALSTICHDIRIPNNRLLTLEQEAVVTARLRDCVVRHQAALAAAAQLQLAFSEPTFIQFTVSLVIICVTAFQLVAQTSNIVRLLSMGTYLMNMMYQVFIYCYQGNQLAVESSLVSGAVYAVPWAACRAPARRALLLMGERSRRVALLTAGGFTTLTLASFMAIIKASYSLFTLLKQVVERN